jgi:uncharacterized protein (TIGR02594 family)
MSTPASALPDKKQPVVKQPSAAAVAPVKKATAQPAKKAVVVSAKKATGAPAKKLAAAASIKKTTIAPAKTAQALKQQRVATAGPVKKVTVSKRPRIASVAPAAMATAPGTVAFDRHAVSSSVEVGQPMRQNVLGQRTEKTALNAPPRAPRLFASADPVSEARRWIGSNPTSRNTLWCATFMNFVLERSGYSGTGSDAASSFAHYGLRIPGPRIGAIAVMTRGKNGGHVGIVSGFDSAGNPIIISGNHGKKVGEGVYPRGRIYAYVLPR